MTTNEIYQLIFGVTVFTAFTGFGFMLLFFNAQGTGGWVDKIIAKRASGGRRRVVARTRRAAA